MKQVQHVEVGDKIYLLLKDEVKEIVLTDDHINNRSHVDPTFLVEKLRLASTAVENDQVKLEKRILLRQFCRNGHRLRLLFRKLRRQSFRQ